MLFALFSKNINQKVFAHDTQSNIVHFKKNFQRIIKKFKRYNLSRFGNLQQNKNR